MSTNMSEPSMPSVPQQSDIRRYNEWADANGRPRWGAPAVAVPKAAARLGRRRPVPVAAAYGQVQGGDGGGFIRGSYIRGGTRYARRTSGEEVPLAVWMPRLNSWRATAAGRAYYEHNRQQHIMNIGITGYKYSDRQGTFIRCTINHLPGGEPLRRVFPYGPNANTEAPDTDGSLEAAQTHILNNVTGWLRSNPIYTQDGEKYRVVTESDIIWVWDEDVPITFDEQVVRHIYSDGRIDFETLMDRPLRGRPLVWEKMYRRVGLCPMAMQ